MNNGLKLSLSYLSRSLLTVSIYVRLIHLIVHAILSFEKQGYNNQLPNAYVTYFLIFYSHEPIYKTRLFVFAISNNWVNREHITYNIWW